MLIENPTRESGDHNSSLCAIRRRRPDGSPNTGAPWLEPFGSTWTFIDDQKTWEVVKYGSGDKLPA